MTGGQEPATTATPGPKESSSSTRRPDTASSKERARPVATERAGSCGRCVRGMLYPTRPAYRPTSGCPKYSATALASTPT